MSHFPRSFFLSHLKQLDSYSSLEISIEWPQANISTFTFVDIYIIRGSISQAFDTLPLLIRQETSSYKCVLDLLLALYHDKDSQVNQGIVEQKILSLLSDG